MFIVNKNEDKNKYQSINQDCPKSKPPKEVPEQTMEFCIECMVPHPLGRCICKLCKTIGHTATECPWLEEAKATTKHPKTDK